MEKLRTGEINESEAKTTLQLFETDYVKYSFIVVDSILMEQARSLVSKYGVKGLRTLDSIQLSTSISLSNEVELFITSDYLLKLFLKLEGLQTEILNS